MMKSVKAVEENGEKSYLNWTLYQIIQFVLQLFDSPLYLVLSGVFILVIIYGHGSPSGNSWATVEYVCM